MIRTCLFRGLLCASVLALAACGKQGALYLPDKQAAQVEQPAQPAPDEPADDKQDPKKDE